MKKNLFLLITLWGLSISQLLAQHQHGQQYPIFKNENAFASNLVEKAVLFSLDPTEYKQLLADRPNHLTLNIPYAAGEFFTVELETNKILSDNFVTTAMIDGQEKNIDYQPGLYYKGKIHGQSSTVAISFFENEIIGIIGTDYGNFVIGAYQPDETIDASTHIIYNDANLLIQNNFECHTDDNLTNSLPTPPSSFFSAPNNYGPVEIYFEADHQLYLDKNSNTAAVNNYITGFFNVVSTLYSNDSIDLLISQTMIWTSADPYPSTSSTAALNAFATAKQNTINGDLGHFISSVNAGNGGLAWKNVLCAVYDPNNLSGPYAYSNIGTSYSTLPTYSWTVMVVSHELGHNIASPHTHACAWNGNNTQIDDCGNVHSTSNNVDDDNDGTTDELDEAEGGACFTIANPIVPATGGTVMSYCHLNAVGININAGFNPQVATVLKNAILAASCIAAKPYCGSQGQSTNDEWIENFTLATINNTSGNNSGYRYFSDLSTNLVPGSVNPISITPGYSGAAYNEYFKIWIDFNQDDDFNDAGEEVFSAGPVTATVTGNITIPLTTTTGSTRLRVSMKYNSLPDTCDNFNFGEVEDYVVNIGNGALTFVNSSITNASCNGSSNGAINVNISGGTAPFSYSWSNNATTQNISNITAGTYSCIITDANNVSVNTGNITITEPSLILPNVTNGHPLCSYNLGTAIATPSGGAGNYSYAWNTTTATTATITNLAAGMHTVTVTDQDGCTATQTVSINLPPSPIASSANITNVVCNGGNTGSINLSLTNAIGNPTYTWSNQSTSEDPTGLIAGNYIVTITDSNGCTHSNNFNITEPAAIVVSVVATQPLCNNTTGSLLANASGGAGSFSYNWSNNLGTAATISNVNNGTYTVTITDASNCTQTASNTIISPPAISVTGAPMDVLCFGDANGSINISTINTQGTTTYAWSNMTNSANPTNLTAGSYIVTVTDSNGCTGINSFTVGSPTQLNSTISATQPLCNTDLGTATITPSGGIAGYSYLWSNNATSASVSNLANGTATVTITDANNCTTTNSTTITQPPLLQFSTAITNACNNNDGAISVTPTGGIPPYVISPNNLTNLAPGNYNVSVTDANNCPTTSQSINLVGSPVAAFDTSIIDRSVSLTNQSQFGTSHIWDFGDGVQSVAPNPTHVYQNSGDFTVTLIVTNPCGSDTSTVDITVFLVSTNTVYDDRRISIYPNPTTDILNIDFDIIGKWQLKLYDIKGRLLIDNQLDINNSKVHQLNVNPLVNGTYLLRFQSLNSDLHIVKKIIIQK